MTKHTLFFELAIFLEEVKLAWGWMSFQTLLLTALLTNYLSMSETTFFFKLAISFVLKPARLFRNLGLLSHFPNLLPK
jgi:hypothetical protein